VTRVSGDLPLDPVSHGDAVVGSGDLIQAVEQDHAPATAQLALPPAAWFPARPAAHRVPYDVWQRDRRIGDDRPGVLTQRKQDGAAPPAQAPEHAGLGAAAGRVGEQGALPASGLADQREDDWRAGTEKFADRVPFRGAGGRPAERAARSLMRGSANQSDIDVDLAQFRDVITAGREILHVEIPERVKHPPPVPAAVARNGRLQNQPFVTLLRSKEPAVSRSRTSPLQS